MPLPKVPTRPAARLDLDALPTPRPPRRRSRTAQGVSTGQAEQSVQAAAQAGLLPVATAGMNPGLGPEAQQPAVQPPAGPAATRTAAPDASATPVAAVRLPGTSPAADRAAYAAASHPAAQAGAQPAAQPAAQPPAQPPAQPAAQTAPQAAAQGAAPSAVPAAAQPAAVADGPLREARAGGRSTEAARSGPSARAPKRRVADGRRKLFVLDTNVLMHDPTALFRFADNDVFLPMVTIEELDDHKRGMSEVSRNARQVSRTLDLLIERGRGEFSRGLPLAALGNTEAGGNLFFQTGPLSTSLPSALPAGKADNQILTATAALREMDDAHQVVLVSKDINMRIKAHALGLAAEDYFSDQVTEDTDVLHGGLVRLPSDFWERHGKGIESWQQGGATYYRIQGPMLSGLTVNQFVFLDGELPLLAQVRERNGNTAVLQTLRDFAHHKHAVWGITARNREQNCALNLLMNPDIDFVTLLGQAGTGKTLLALAAGLAQTLDHKRYSEIIMTRATVPVGDDIGYLPGTEEEKMQPWMGALEDNLEVLNQGAGGEWARSAAVDLIRSRIRVKALSFMRGRTFVNKFLIIDEAQNLTPKQLKTLITRAGAGTKVICMGNVAQIDTPYLTEYSSGLTYVVERFKGWAHAGHVALQRGERSRLADFATEAL